MKGPRELKRFMGALRSWYGKRNGVVARYALDELTLIKLARCRKARKAYRRARDGSSA